MAAWAKQSADLKISWVSIPFVTLSGIIILTMWFLPHGPILWLDLDSSLLASSKEKGKGKEGQIPFSSEHFLKVTKDAFSFITLTRTGIQTL